MYAIRSYYGILGRVALDDVEDPFSGSTIVEAGEEITEDVVEKITAAGIDRIRNNFV